MFESFFAICADRWHCQLYNVSYSPRGPNASKNCQRRNLPNHKKVSFQRFQFINFIRLSFLGKDCHSNRLDASYRSWEVFDFQKFWTMSSWNSFYVDSRQCWPKGFIRREIRLEDFQISSYPTHTSFKLNHFCFCIEFDLNQPAERSQTPSSN